jgi:phosphatidylglycerophosphate synthase
VNAREVLEVKWDSVRDATFRLAVLAGMIALSLYDVLGLHSRLPLPFGALFWQLFLLTSSMGFMAILSARHQYQPRLLGLRRSATLLIVIPGSMTLLVVQGADRFVWLVWACLVFPTVLYVAVNDVIKTKKDLRRTCSSSPARAGR